MARYAWIIDKDHISIPEDEYDESGTVGPRDAGRLGEYLENGGTAGKQFRMYDDDKVLIYEGRITGDYTGFEPLDDFGEPNAGCTIIRYRNGKKWEVL